MNILINCQFDFFSAQSNQINKTRLKVLQFRDERLSEIIEEAKNSLPSLKTEVTSYSELLFKLSLDIFFHLMENEVTLECLPEDLELVKAASLKASDSFMEITGLNIVVNVIGQLSSEQ